MPPSVLELIPALCFHPRLRLDPGLKLPTATWMDAPPRCPLSLRSHRISSQPLFSADPQRALWGEGMLSHLNAHVGQDHGDDRPPSPPHPAPSSSPRPFRPLSPVLAARPPECASPRRSGPRPGPSGREDLVAAFACRDVVPVRGGGAGRS